MNKVTIVINGQEADYSNDKNFPVRLYRSLADFKDPATRKGERTYTIKLPLTENNRRILGNLQLLEKRGKYSTLQPREVVVYSDSITIIEGRLFISKVTNESVECYIVAQTGTVSTILQGKSLRDIQSLPDVPFDGIPTIISTTEEMNNGLSPLVPLIYDKPIFFPVICYGKFFIPNVWTSLNLTNYLPTAEYVPASSQSFTTIPLPEGREILGIQEWYLDYSSQPTTSFQDYPPCFLVAWILRAMFEDAGYALAGSWIEDERVNKLCQPYTSDRDPIWNWERMGAMSATSVPPSQFAESAQQVNIKFTGEYTGLVNGYNIHTNPGDKFYDKFYTFNFASFPTGYPLTPPNAFDSWTVLYNVLQYEWRALDLSLSIYTTPGKEWSIITIPVDGIYTFNYSFLVQANLPTDVTKQGVTQRTFGCTRFSGEIPSNLCFGKTIDDTQINENLLYFTRLTGVPNGTTFADEFTVELKKGDRLVFWLGLATFYRLFETEDVYVNPHVLPYASPPSVFASPYIPNPSLLGDLFVDTYVEIKELYISASVVDLPTTPTPDVFGYDLKVAQNLPDVQQIDYLKSFLSLFNLYLYIDEKAKVVYLEPGGEFFMPKSTAYDITEKTNRSTFVQSPPDISRLYRYVWNKDSADEVTKRYGGNYDLIFDTEVSQATGSANIDSGIFASTELRSFSVIQTNNLNDFVNPNYVSINELRIPHLASADDLKTALNATRTPSYAYQPRLLQLDKVIPFSDDPNVGMNCVYFDLNNVPLGFQNQSTKLLRFIQLDFNTNPLSGGQPYTIPLGWGSDNGLQNQYYKSYYYDLSKGYEAEADVLMTAFDYRQMQINRPVIYDGIIFYLKEISGFDPTKPQRIKIKLIKK